MDLIKYDTGFKHNALLCIVLSLAFSLLGGAQENPDYTLDYIDVSDGLSNDYVSKIVEDNQGLKWFAAEGGLNKYDGQSFSLYRPNERFSGLKNENIETIFKNRQGHIWTGTKSGGLSKYDIIKDRFECFNWIFDKNDPEDEGLRILAINEDGQGNIWIASAYNGIVVFNPSNKKVKYRFDENSSYISSTKIILDSYHNIWVCISNKLFKFDASKEKLIRINFDGPRLLQIIELKDRDEILLLTELGLYALNTDNYSSKKILLHGSYFKKFSTASLAPDGKLWFGSWESGLFRTNKDFTKIQKIDLRPDFYSPDNKKYELILDIFHDSHGLVWVATGYGGVVKLSPSKSFKTIANTINNDVGLPENNIHALTVDKNDRFWCGTWSQGLAYKNGESSYKKLEDMGNFKVNVFLETAERLFIGTREGLFSLENSDPKARLVKHPIDFSNITTLAVYNDELWMGSVIEGMAIVPMNEILAPKNVRYINKQSDNGLISSRISTFRIDKKNRIWVGTYNGLYSYDPSSKTFKRYDKEIGGFPSVIILSIFLDSDDTLWTGVPGGLLEIDIRTGRPTLINAFTKANGIFNDYMTAITGDSYGNIWVSTAGGISKLNKEKGLITNYGIDDGISSISFNINSFFNDGDTIYFGSNNGILKFNPDFVNENTLPPNLVFTSLKLNNKEVQVNEVAHENKVLEANFSHTDHINLTHKDKIISFTVSSTDFLSLDEINYYYKLEGLHDEWVNNYNSPVISLSGLSSGNYRLLSKASRDNVNFGDVLSLSIKVKTSPWNSWYAYLLYAFVLTVILVLVVMTLNKQTKLKSSLEIAKIAQEKEHDLTEAKLGFFTNISHEFKTPLTLIMAPLSQLLSDNGLGKSAKQKITTIHSNANRLLHLINQLLDFRKTENGILNLRAAKGNFASFTYEIYLSFEGLAKSKNIDYRYTCHPNEIQLTYDRDKMEIVLCNLLSNAFRHTESGGAIRVKLEENEDHVDLMVIDNGSGIPEKYHNKIFNRFYQIKETDSLHMVGSGIGLSFSKKIVEQHHGTLTVQSELEKGSVFTVTFPKGEEFFRVDEIFRDFQGNDRVSEVREHAMHPETNGSIRKPKETLHGPYPQVKKNDRTSILIVDDNMEILSFLEELLSDTYRVITAHDGMQALDIVSQELPDIVLSDVMMPGLNGISLCSKIKSNQLTSHIPVVLLTARTATVFEVDGLKTGADDYIKKPFDPAIVKARLESILENRDKLRKYFLNKLRFHPNDTIEIKDFEGAFLRKAIEFIDKNIESDTLSIDSLADHMCMSQSTLFRKIKSLTGLSSSALIRTIRLKNAAEKMCSESISLKQVAFEVGFKDYKHFKNCFKAQFRCLPSEYRVFHCQKNDMGKQGNGISGWKNNIHDPSFNN